MGLTLVFRWNSAIRGNFNFYFSAVSASTKKLLVWSKDWSLVWLLKCCRNKNSYDMKIYFHSIKIILYSIKYIFIISLFSHDTKIYFYSVKINLYSVRNFFVIYIFFIQAKYILIIWVFHWIHSWRTYLVFHLYLQKSEFYFQYVNWTTARGCEY